MSRRSIIMTIALLILAILAWGELRYGFAKEEVYLSLKIQKKLDTVLNNQAEIKRSIDRLSRKVDKLRRGK